jgi:hypothetical protein
MKKVTQITMQQPTFILIMMGLFFSGCANSKPPQRNTDALIQQVSCRDLADKKRLQILDTVLAQPLNEKQQQELGNILSEVVVSPLHSPVIRSRTVEIITDRYPADAPIWLGRALLTATEPEIQQQIIQSLAHLNNKQALPFLVEALARTPDSNPLHISITETIEQIAQQPLADLLKSQLTTSDSLSVKLAALSCLQTQLGHDETVKIVTSLPPNNVVSEQLTFWATHFHYLPTNKSRFLLCQLQRMNLSSDQLAELENRVILFNQKHKYQFDVRDTYTILHTDKETLALDRNRLTTSISARLNPLSHTKRPPSYPGAPDDYDEDFTSQHEKLSYPDLIRIVLLLDTIAQSDTTNQLRRFVSQDTANPQSELGGLCILDEAANFLIFRAYPSQRQGGDNQYHWSAEMHHDRALSLAVWHCHANKNLTPQAGPGLDDLQHAASHNYPALVITALPDDRFNIDYYTPDQIVIDLGNYSF